MHSATYFLLESADRNIIVHGATGLRVNVFSLDNEPYVPTGGELHIFGDDHGEWLTFETEGWAGESMDLISGAVVWFARYLDYPEMEITTVDPHRDLHLKKSSKNMTPTDEE